MPYKDRDRQRAFQREWIQRRRATWLEENGPCTRCGSTDDLVAASKNPAKPIPHRVWTYSETRRDAVLAGCVVLCRSCFLRHRFPAPEHGTVARYDSRLYPCRCDLCRAARSRAEHARRKRKRGRTDEERAAAVEAWREREHNRLIAAARKLRPEHVRAIRDRWLAEIKPLVLPPLARDLGRQVVEPVFLAIAAEGRDGVSTSDVLHESALSPTDAATLVDVLLRSGLVVRVRSRLVARRVRRAEQRLQRACVEFQSLRRRCEDSTDASVEFDEPDPEVLAETLDDERSSPWQSTLERVMFKLFGLDD